MKTASGVCRVGQLILCRLSLRLARQTSPGLGGGHRPGWAGGASRLSCKCESRSLPSAGTDKDGLLAKACATDVVIDRVKEEVKAGKASRQYAR